MTRRRVPAEDPIDQDELFFLIHGDADKLEARYGDFDAVVRRLLPVIAPPEWPVAEEYNFIDFLVLTRGLRRG